MHDWEDPDEEDTPQYTWESTGLTAADIVVMTNNLVAHTQPNHPTPNTISEPIEIERPTWQRLRWGDGSPWYSKTFYNDSDSYEDY